MPLCGGEEGAGGEGSKGGSEVGDVAMKSLEEAGAGKLEGFREPGKAVADASVAGVSCPDAVAAVVFDGGAKVEAMGAMGGPGAT